MLAHLSQLFFPLPLCLLFGFGYCFPIFGHGLQQPLGYLQAEPLANLQCQNLARQKRDRRRRETDMLACCQLVPPQVPSNIMAWHTVPCPNIRLTQSACVGIIPASKTSKTAKPLTLNPTLGWPQPENLDYFFQPCAVGCPAGNRCQPGTPRYNL